MKTQNVLLSFGIVFLMISFSSETYIRDFITRRPPFGNIGKRSLKDVESLDFLFDPTFTAADLAVLENALEDY
uniref:Peptide Ctri9194 n=1 Tax=Chaerilus tricostatus TaxID=1055734 RepID=NDB4V_CHATC|nr:RecName: Full=Peptide Ctri9194; Flags: Precursor [Chaerilus tricostatus]